MTGAPPVNLNWGTLSGETSSSWKESPEPTSFTSALAGSTCSNIARLEELARRFCLELRYRRGISIWLFSMKTSGSEDQSKSSTAS